MRILIAEDEVTIARALKVMLERNKYAVDVVFNGKDALDYWGFVCMGLHLGLHWSMMLTMARKHLQPSPLRTWSLCLIGWLWALYGALAFHRRDVGLYLLLKSHFVFYDYSEPVIFFLIDYFSVMALFVLIGYYFIQGLKRSARLGQGLCRMDESDFLKRG